MSKARNEALKIGHMFARCLATTFATFCVISFFLATA